MEMDAATEGAEPTQPGREPVRPATVAGAWEWTVATDRLVLSEWLRRDRALPPAYAVTTVQAMLARVHADDRDYVEESMRGAAARRQPFAATYRTLDGLGRLRTVTNAADIAPDGPTRYIGASIDLPTATAATQAGQAPFVDAILETLVEGLVACSRSGVPLVVNRAARRLYETTTGTRWDEHEGRLWIERLLVSRPREGQLAPWRDPVGLALAGNPVTDLEIEVGDTPGARTVVLLSAHPITAADQAVQGAVVTLQDVTEQRAAEAIVARDATHDRVTGLPNRRQLSEHLADVLRTHDHATVAVVVVEVEGVDRINETFGYDAGDAVLAAAARSLAGELGADDFAAALDAGQFAVVCADRAQERAEALATRIVRTVGTPRALPRVPAAAGGDLTVTARAGIAFTEANLAPEVLLGHARTAAAGVDGGGVATYQPDDGLPGALRAAVAGGELVLHYQPKFDLETRRIAGVEALVRWERPGHGLVPPDQFIPAAERCGVIVDLGTWVLRTALADVRRWMAAAAAPPRFHVAVNVSAAQFDAGFTDTVRAILAELAVPASVLCVEVTESLVMRDVRSAVATLHALRHLGVTVAIDDFGTGYSSLAYLRDFPADELKIDRSFVAELGSHGATALVGGVVSIAHALSLDVVAEGVETDEQLVALATVGCDTVQGYLFSPPVPAPRVDELLAAAPAHPHVVADPRPGALASDVVLVADDAADVRLLARMSLATSGFEVHEAGDGRSALKVARRVRPATVVLDVAMPLMDGLAVCRALRADEATRDCTIVMLTATGTAADKIDAYAAGADEYIVKPFTPRDLVSRVRAAQRRRVETSARAT